GRRRRFGWTDALARLNRGLLIAAHDCFTLRGQGLCVLIEIEHRGRLLHELRIGRMLPRVIAPRFDLVLPEPGADRPWREPRHDLLLDGNLRELLSRPASPWLAVLTGRATGERRNLGPLQRRERALAPRACHIVQTVGYLPALPPALHSIDTTAHATGNLCVTPGGMLMRQQENPRPLDFRKWGSITGAEVVQLHLLLWREWDGILG